MSQMMTRLRTRSPPQIPVSWGELIDKITILEIKRERLTDAVARASVEKELTLLAKIAAAVLNDKHTQGLAARLKAANLSLWEIEDKIRDKEAKRQFDLEFVELARSIYKRNDERSALKREINLALKSELIEEKSYKPY